MELPVNIGDIVYTIGISHYKPVIVPRKVKEIIITEDGIYCDYEPSGRWGRCDRWGDDVFATEAEAKEFIDKDIKK